MLHTDSKEYSLLVFFSDGHITTRQQNSCWQNCYSIADCTGMLLFITPYYSEIYRFQVGPLKDLPLQYVTRLPLRQILSLTESAPHLIRYKVTFSADKTIPISAFVG